MSAEPADATEPVATVTAVHPVAVSRSAPVALSTPRALGILGLFMLGFAIGVFTFLQSSHGLAPSHYPGLPGAPEPAAAHTLASAVDSNDAPGVASAVLPAIAQQLAAALDPIVDVRHVTYVGTVQLGNRQLAGYVAQGRDKDGADRLIGFVVDVQNDFVVGINQ